MNMLKDKSTEEYCELLARLLFVHENGENKKVRPSGIESKSYGGA